MTENTSIIDYSVLLCLIPETSAVCSCPEPVESVGQRPGQTLHPITTGHLLPPSALRLSGAPSGGSGPTGPTVPRLPTKPAAIQVKIVYIRLCGKHSLDESAIEPLGVYVCLRLAVLI